MYVNLTNKTNFNGIHIANTANCINGVKTKLKIYEITPDDRTFLNAMYNATCLEELISGISTEKMEVWYSMFKNAVELTTNNNVKSFLVAKNSKPCGILACSVKPQQYKVDYVCTWPVKKGEKVPLAGKTLFRALFEDFINQPLNRMELDAIKNGPYDTVSKYMQLGFRSVGGENFIEVMRTNKNRITDTIKKLDSLMTFTKTNSTDDVNLFNVLKV